MSKKPWSIWWTQRLHPPASTTHLLGWHNVYVWPTRAGWLMLVVWCVLMLVSVNYQLNLGYLLGFLLAGSVLASVWVGHCNVRGLQLQLLPITPVFAGQTIALNFQVTNVQNRKKGHYAILLATRQKRELAPSWACLDVSPQAQAECTLGMPSHHRGLLCISVVTVHSVFPLGVFRFWSHWQPQQKVWVYPEPASLETQHYNQVAVHSFNGLTTAINAGEADGVRLYERGDPVRHILWRKAAQTLAQGRDDLVIRHFPEGHNNSVWIDETQTHSSDRELRLSELCARALASHSRPHAWGLRLQTGEVIAPNQGDSHLHQCLQLLALQPLATSEQKV